MCKHWCKTFLTFLSSFDSQVPQGHCYNLTIPRVSSTLRVLPILPITIESLSSTLFFIHNEIMFHPLLQQGMWNDPLKPTLGVMNTVSSSTLASTAGKLESNVPHHVFLDGEISYRTLQIQKDFEIEWEDGNLFFKSATLYSQHTLAVGMIASQTKYLELFYGK